MFELNLFFSKYGTGDYNSVLKASQFFGCLDNCTCGYQTFSFKGETQRVYISTLQCCDSSNNCNSATDSSLYSLTVSCGGSSNGQGDYNPSPRKSDGLVLTPNKFDLILIGTCAMFLF